MGFQRTLEKKCGRLGRALRKRWLRLRLRNRDFSLFTPNCLGGVVLSLVGQRFNSPTINLLMNPPYYIKFLERPKHYLGCELREIETDAPYPVAMLDDIRIDFMHYSDFETAKAKWEERSGRIHWDNLYVMMLAWPDCDREMVERFDALPYAHKVCFTIREYPDIPSAYAMPRAFRGGGFASGLTAYRDKLQIYRWIDEFDYVAFFNQK